MKFKPEDIEEAFMPCMGMRIGERRAYEIACENLNAKLQEWLDTAPTAWFDSPDEGWREDPVNPNYPFERKAKLVCIEEIE